MKPWFSGAEVPAYESGDNSFVNQAAAAAFVGGSLGVGVVGRSRDESRG
jgi:hypothetical protein